MRAHESASPCRATWSIPLGTELAQVVPRSLGLSALSTFGWMVVTAGLSHIPKVTIQTLSFASTGPARLPSQRSNPLPLAGLPLAKLLFGYFGCLPGTDSGEALGHCDHRGSDVDSPPDDCWTTGGAISVLYAAPQNAAAPEVPEEVEPPASMCTVSFWPSGEHIPSMEASQAYTASIRLAAESGNYLMGELTVIDLSALAARMLRWRNQRKLDAWGNLQPRAVLIVPDDVSSGSRLPNGHLFDQSFNVYVTAPQRVAVPVRVLVLGPA